MDRLKSNKIFFYSASLILHGALLLIAMITLAAISPQQTGSKGLRFLPSYLSDPADSSQRMPSVMHYSTEVIEKKLKYERAHKSSQTLYTKRAHLSHQPSHLPLSILKKKSKKGLLPNALLMLLHTAIQRQQRYPASALQMERQGTVTVSFTLLKDGTVQHIRIVKSSGTVSLDKAALAAVYDANPFNGVDNYLESTKDFNIDVSFALSP